MGITLCKSCRCDNTVNLTSNLKRIDGKIIADGQFSTSDGAGDSDPPSSLPDAPSVAAAAELFSG